MFSDKRDMDAAYLDDLKPTLQDVVSHLAGDSLWNRTSLERAVIRHRAVKHVC